MVGDVGTAYLNAKIPRDDPEKTLYMIIDEAVAEIMIKEDPSFTPFQRHDRSLLVRLDKALDASVEGLVQSH